MKRGLSVLAWLGLFALLPAMAQAQTATLTGTVVADDTGEPLAGANVLVRQAGSVALAAGAATNSAGSYTISGLAPGRYSVVFRFVGFKDSEAEVTLAAGQTQTLDARLSEGLTLNPVVVTASRQQEKSLDAPASISVLEAREIEQDAAPSAAATLRNTTGVDLAQAGLDRYQISLRGFNAAFVAKSYAMVDFRQTVAPSLGINSFAAMPIAPIDLEQVEVVRGPGSALYGPGVEQGVVHFRTKDPLTYPGTSVMIGGGERSLIQGAVRHAGALNNQFGYKIVGYYSQGDDWELDPTSQDDLDVLCAIGRGKNGEASVCGQEENGDLVPIDLAERDNETWKYYGLGTLQYRVRPSVTVTLNGGYSSQKQINIANTGENQTDNFASIFTQLRVDAGGFFGQVYYNANDAGDTYFYRSGATVVDKSQQITAQAQYAFALAEGRENIIVGVDYKLTNPQTEGVIHGRFEDRDKITEIGGYLQSETNLTEQLDLVLVGRVDWNDVTEEVQLSPRAAVVFKPTPQQSIRATFNRAFSTPAGVNFFLDLFVQDGGAFTVRGVGAVDGWTFPDPLQTSSFVPGVGRYPGIGLPLNVAYGAALQGLIGAGAFDAFPPEARAAFIQLLQSKLASIGGFSEGVLINTAGQIVTAVNDLPPIEQTITNTAEIGYKGLIDERILISVDGYYTKKTNFLSELRTITPLVAVPNIGNDLGAAVAAAFTPEELAAFGLSPQAVAGFFQQAAGAIAANPVGLVETNENFDGATRPELMLTYINFGDIDFYGADVAVQYLINDQVDVFANYSWVSDNLFDQDEVGEPGTGLEISTNAPEHKVRGGFNARLANGLSFNAAGRYVGEYEVRSGIHNGTVDSYFLLDLGAGYDFRQQVPGLRLDITAQNVLDNEHREYIDVPALGRLVTARLTYKLP